MFYGNENKSRRIFGDYTAMNLDVFMIWRFRNVEGVLADIKSVNMDCCIFNNGSKITYDFKNEMVTIDDNNSIFPKVKTIPIRECTKDVLINEYKFKERFDNRHNLSFQNKEE